MLSRHSRTLHKFARGWLIFVLFLLQVMFMIFIMPLSASLMRFDSGGPGPIDLLFFYTPAKAYSMVEAYGQYGRIFYRNTELTLDLIYPIIYTLLFGLLLSWLFRRGFSSQSPIQRWNVLPLGGWLFDLLENLGIVGMLSLYPAQPSALGWATALFTLVKWLFAGANLLLVSYAFIMAARNRFQRQT